MSGKIPIATNKYSSIKEEVTNMGGEISRPFLVTRYLDYVLNDGPGEAEIRLDEGAPIPLDAGAYIGPWLDFRCSTVYIKCTTQGGSCTVKCVGV